NVMLDAAHALKVTGAAMPASVPPVQSSCPNDIPKAASTQSIESVWLQALIGAPLSFTLPSPSPSIPWGGNPAPLQPSQYWNEAALWTGGRNPFGRAGPRP